MNTSAVLVGAMVGVFTSVIAWLLVYSLFRPRLRWSNILTKWDRGAKDPHRWRYGMVLTNAGLWRSAVAVTVTCRARIKLPYMGDQVPTNYYTFEIPTDTPFVRGHVKVLAGGQEKSSRW